MKKVTRAEMTDLLDGLEKDPHQEPVVLMRGRKPIAVILPVGNADMETVAVSFNPQLQAMLERSRRRAEHEGYVSAEEVRKRLGLPPFKERKKKAKSAGSRSIARG